LRGLKPHFGFVLNPVQGLKLVADMTGDRAAGVISGADAFKLYVL
jgi:hypothetical protein